MQLNLAHGAETKNNEKLNTKPSSSEETVRAVPFLPRVPKWGRVNKGFDARLANRPFLVFDFRALALDPERQSARKSKTKNGRFPELVSAELFWAQ